MSPDWYPVARRAAGRVTGTREPVLRRVDPEDVTVTQAGLRGPVVVDGEVFGFIREVFVPGEDVANILGLYEEMLIEMAL
jgi:hypothetical protein